MRLTDRLLKVVVHDARRKFLAILYFGLPWGYDKCKGFEIVNFTKSRFVVFQRLAEGPLNRGEKMEHLQERCIYVSLNLRTHMLSLASKSAGDAMRG